MQEELALLILEAIDHTYALETLLKEVNIYLQKYMNMTIQDIVGAIKDEVNIYKDVREYGIPPSKNNNQEKPLKTILKTCDKRG